jgi:hypothetical protein
MMVHFSDIFQPTLLNQLLSMSCQSIPVILASYVKQTEQLARAKSSEADLSSSEKHCLYKVIQKNGDVRSIDDETGLSDVVEH